MQHADDRTLDRIRRVVRDWLTPGIYLESRPLDVSAWRAPGEPVPFSEATRQSYSPVSPPFPWGRAWSTTWFHLTGSAPEAWAQPNTTIEVVVDLGFDDNSTGFQAEGLAWTPTGDIVKAIQPTNRYISVKAGPVDFYVEAAANPPIMGASPDTFRPTQLGRWDTAGEATLYVLKQADLRLRSVPTWELVQDIAVLMGLVEHLPSASTRRATIIEALCTMVDVIDPHDIHGTADIARQSLAPVLDARTSGSPHQIYATGHAHIDCAWLWPIRESVRKCARTFSNQLALMDQYPEHVFACSSAQQLFWIKQTYPLLYARICDKVAEGQFIPIGSMWVEADATMTGGEAFVRQLVFGKRFFLNEFGIETKEMWLPDSFGYSGALPQLARLAGCDWFLSQKLSWNDTDVMPHHTFWWEGIDGSRVFTHFPPVDTYNSDLSPRDLLHAETNFADKGRASRSLVPFGWGDGGGGPTREMLAAAKRSVDMEGLPKVRLVPPSEFFRDARAEYSEAPTWVGEMYLEFHRGVYTSQARTKAGNRRCEHLLREAELWCTTASVQQSAPYPYDELDRLWRVMLLNQFHDILPGSSINWVHRETEKAHSSIAEDAEAVISAAVGAVVGAGDVPILMNSTPTERSGVKALAAGCPKVPADPDVLAERKPDGSVVLENGLVRLTITASGTFSSLLDLAANREVLPTGMSGNILRLHRDQPTSWDAWDLDREYRRVSLELTDVESIEIEGDADERHVEIARSFGASRITQTLRLGRGSSAIEIVNDIDWHERQQLLKLVFPIAVQTDRAAYETQFGHVWRTTHNNTSWDAAKYEACAHRWVWVGDTGYGVGIANSATYGHNITHMTGSDGRPYTEVGLSLLRAPLFPDPDADAGHHVRTITLHPGATVEETIVDGYRANLPPRIVRGAHEAQPLVSVSNSAVLIEAVKLADDRSGDVIVRLYESLGGSAEAIMSASFPVETIRVVDLLERPLNEANSMDGSELATSGFPIALHPFEILTLRLQRIHDR